MIYLKAEVIEKLAALITAAFGLIAALAWNDAIKNLMLTLGLEKFGPWVYAIVITIVAVLVAIWIGKATEKAKAK